jgi:hypothetical protein
VGDSAAMRAVKERIGKVARSMGAVLVRGESEPARNWWPAPSTPAAIAATGPSSP